MYQLQTVDGRPLGKVLKVNRGDIGSQMLNNNQASGVEAVWAGAEMCLVPASAPATGWFGDFGGREAVGLLLGFWIRADASPRPRPPAQVWVGMDKEVGQRAAQCLGAAHATYRAAVALVLLHDPG